MHYLQLSTLRTAKFIFFKNQEKLHYKPGFPKLGRIAPLGAILVSWGAKIRKGAKRGRF